MYRRKISNENMEIKYAIKTYKDINEKQKFAKERYQTSD